MSFQTLTRLITAPDPDALNVPVVTTDGQEFLIVGLSCDTANATLACRVIWATSAGGFLAVGQPITFTSGPTAIWGTAYLATPNASPEIPALGDHAIIKVDSITPATSKWQMCTGLR